MNDINRVLVIGRLTKDVTVSYTSKGVACGKASIAVNEGRKKGDSYEDYANFFDVDIWGKLAETLKSFLTKGKQVAIEGHLQQQRWEKNGEKHSTVVIVADSIQLVGGKDNAVQNNGNVQQQPAQQNQQQGLGFTEDIPF